MTKDFIHYNPYHTYLSMFLTTLKALTFALICSMIDTRYDYTRYSSYTKWRRHV